MLASWSLRTKLLCSFFLSSLFTFSVGYFGVISLTNAVETSAKLNQVAFPQVIDLIDMKRSAQEALYHTLQLRLVGNDAKELESLRRVKLKKDFEDFDSAYKHLKSLSVSKTAGEKLEKTIHAWGEVRKRIEEAADLAMDTSYGSHIKFGDFFRGPFRENRNDLYKSFAEANEIFRTEMDTEVKEAEAKANHQRRGMMVGAFLGLIFSMLVGYLITRSLYRSMEKVTSSLNTQSGELQKTSDGLASVSQSLTSSIQEEAAAVQETASSLEEISAMVKKNADNSNQSEKIATETAEQATKGREVVGEMIQSMDSIRESNSAIMKQIELSNQELTQIIQLISEIGSKTKVINDIVFQTKLLSFNASVEAARAGEQGKGFAVVAEEVGNLAQMSGNAAKEITDILDGSIIKVERIVNDTKESVGRLIISAKVRVDSGVDTARKSGEVLDTLVGNVAQVSSRVREIAIASLEQSNGVEEISKAIAQIDQTTQENSKSALEASHSAEVLKENAHAVRECVRELQAILGRPSA